MAKVKVNNLGGQKTHRQKLILQTVVDEYIKNAFPISSDFLKNECDLEVCPATIRLDLVELTQHGFLQKPHISSGRVPTDKGYRFFVDSFFAEDQAEHQADKTIDSFYSLFGEMNDMLKLSHEIARNLALASSNLGFVHFEDSDIFWKEGWEEIVKAPEFSNIDYFKYFMDLVNDFEKNIKKIQFKKDEKIKIYIGKELPLKEKEFSVIVGKPVVAKNKTSQPTLAILGPKRMDFKRNIQLVNSLIDVMENLPC